MHPRKHQAETELKVRPASSHPAIDDPAIDWQAVCPADVAQPGFRGCFEVDGEKVLVLQEATQLYALGALCTHAHLELAGGRIRQGALICPFHGARFDLATGRSLAPPVVADLPCYPVRIANGMIEVGTR